MRSPSKSPFKSPKSSPVHKTSPKKTASSIPTATMQSIPGTRHTVSRHSCVKEDTSPTHTSYLRYEKRDYHIYNIICASSCRRLPVNASSLLQMPAIAGDYRHLPKYARVCRSKVEICIVPIIAGDC